MAWQGLFSVPAPGLSSDTLCYAPAVWVEFPQAEARKLPTGSPTSKSLGDGENYGFLDRALGLRVRLDVWFLLRLGTLSDWGQRAKRLGRSLGAYTPAPSTSSSLRALVQTNASVARRVN